MACFPLSPPNAREPLGFSSLGSSVGGLAGRSAQHPGDGYGDGPAGERPEHVGPPVAPMTADNGRAQGAGRVHRRPRDRGCPQTGQDDVARNSKGGVGADVAGTGGGAEDHAYQAGGEDQLDQYGGRARWSLTPGSLAPRWPMLPKLARRKPAASTLPASWAAT